MCTPGRARWTRNGNREGGGENAAEGFPARVEGLGLFSRGRAWHAFGGRCGGCSPRPAEKPEDQFPIFQLKSRFRKRRRARNYHIHSTEQKSMRGTRLGAVFPVFCFGAW